MTGGGLRIGEEDVMSDGGAEVGIHGGVTIMSLCTNVPTFFQRPHVLFLTEFFSQDLY